MRKDGVAVDVVYDAVCDCGTDRRVRGYQLRSGRTTSCGCARPVPSQLRHGHSKREKDSPEYVAWRSMIGRCRNPKATNYRWYGGRGISVCDRWSSFDAFLEDMGTRPPGCNIERIDNSGNYEPGNCRWATRKEQGRNKRNNVVLSMNGETLCVAEWAERTGIKRHTISARLAKGWPVDRALSVPVRALVRRDPEMFGVRKEKKG